MIIVAECYANTCFAEALRGVLREKGFLEVRIVHKHVMGRDRVLRESLAIADKTNDFVLAVIDREEGIASSYIDKNFKIQETYEGILLGVSNRASNLLAVIFDPDIERAFLCKIASVLCEEGYRRRVKSGGACSILGRYLGGERAQDILRGLAEELKAMIGGGRVRDRG